MPVHDKIPAHLESRIEVSDGLAIFRFTLARDFRFIPGQYATLWLTHAGQRLARPYSIASSPSEKRRLEFYVNLVSEGKLTPSLWEAEAIDGLRAGDPGTQAAVTGPRGRFVLNPADERDLVFVASGTGLAPFISMIRKMKEDLEGVPKSARPRRVYVIHGVSYPNHLGYREELEKIAAESLRDPRRTLRLVYLPTISRPYIDSTWTGLKGRAETLLELPPARKASNPDLEETVKRMLGAIVQPETHAVFVCGHAGTVDHVVGNLTRRGFRLDADLYHEKYYL